MIDVNTTVIRLMSTSVDFMLEYSVYIHLNSNFIHTRNQLLLIQTVILQYEVHGVIEPVISWNPHLKESKYGREINLVW